MKQKEPKRIEIPPEEIDRYKDLIDSSNYSVEDKEIMKTIFDLYRAFYRMLELKNTTIRRLKQLVFGTRTEKTRDVIKKEAPSTEESTASKDPESNNCSSDRKKKKRKGHGRNGADSYTGAERVYVSLESLHIGDRCPECEKGNLYDTDDPGTIVSIVGNAPIQGTVYKLQKLRCSTCGELFSAEPPQEDKKKYKESAGAMIELLKYGSGFPFYRLEKLQAGLGIPLPTSTQWDIVESDGNRNYHVFEHLKYEAAQGDVVYNDDTIMKILTNMGINPDDPSRTGNFTTGILSIKDGHKIAIFQTGRQHAGENMSELLKHRHHDRAPPIQMCDAASRNVPKEFQVILGNCNAHARRRFVDVAWSFPDECEYVLEIFQKVYKNDAVTKEKQMSAQDRLAYHQEQSAPQMSELKSWLHEQFDKNKVEPNSGLGQAITYMINHWNELTLFLRVPNAPLDNNICERALKKAILHRKNSLFYRTQLGAYVGDLFMSLIHTCNLCNVNPFEYLVALQKYAHLTRKNPAIWMPWNYKDTLLALAA
jgi:hypothetical protein